MPPPLLDLPTKTESSLACGQRPFAGWAAPEVVFRHCERPFTGRECEYQCDLAIPSRALHASMEELRSHFRELQTRPRNAEGQVNGRPQCSIGRLCT